VNATTRITRLLSVWVAVWVVLCAGEAQAAIERYAVVIGNNRGEADEKNLRYAQADAAKVYDVLRELGGFAPENMVLLEGEGADAVQRVLIAFNERIRSQTGRTDQAVLFVYYSGHADADALHLGSDRLEISRLRALVRGSSANMRILMLDSCRSGSLTRVKGGAQAPAFDITLDEQLAGEGMVLLTSASANEDAQESDALKGSFFTHYFVSGLLGAADADASGKVTLEEAYAYAYDHTLRASSRTVVGTQHPTFEFDLRGRGGTVLTAVDAALSGRARLVFPRGRTYLVFSESETGAVVAEVGVHDKAREISVKPGRYFVRGRARDHLLEGTIRLSARETHNVRDRELRRIEYARLARKGGLDRRVAHGPQVGYQLRTPLWSDASLCHGVRAGYAVEHRWLSVTPRFGFCRSGFDNGRIVATSDEFDLDLTLTHVFDVPVVSIGVGVVGGVTWLRQTFETAGVAPPRNTIGGHLDIVLALLWDLPRGFYIETDIAGQVHLFSGQTANEPDSKLATVVTARPYVGFGKRF
jgi:hypothetical protein